MININEHIVEIEGTKYVPYNVAIKAINQQYSQTLSESMSDFREKMSDALKGIDKIDD
ncbi:MAG: hypothetical protein ACKVJ6_08160 [Flavobacteriales bacterium]